MLIKTKVFGEIEVREETIIEFPSGIIGFPEMKKFLLIHEEEEEKKGIRWLQSIEEPGFAMPVMDPLAILEEYNPEIEEELLKEIGEVTQENILALVTLSVPSDLTKMSINLQGPIIINAEERKACQIILDTDKYPVKYYIYDILNERAKQNGGQ